MPGDKSSQNDEQALQKYNVEQRRAVNNAYAAITAQQSTLTFQAFTFEEAVDLLIESIEGGGTQLRPNQLGRVDQIEQNVQKAVEQIKQVPPEQFIEHDEEKDVNTEPEETAI